MTVVEWTLEWILRSLNSDFLLAADTTISICSYGAMDFSRITIFQRSKDFGLLFNLALV